MPRGASKKVKDKDKGKGSVSKVQKQQQLVQDLDTARGERLANIGIGTLPDDYG